MLPSSCSCSTVRQFEYSETLHGVLLVSDGSLEAHLHWIPRKACKYLTAGFICREENWTPLVVMDGIRTEGTSSVYLGALSLDQYSKGIHSVC